MNSKLWDECHQVLWPRSLIVIFFPSGIFVCVRSYGEENYRLLNFRIAFRLLDPTPLANNGATSSSYVLYMELKIGSLNG